MPPTRQEELERRRHERLMRERAEAARRYMRERAEAIRADVDRVLLDRDATREVVTAAAQALDALMYENDRTAEGAAMVARTALRTAFRDRTGLRP